MTGIRFVPIALSSLFTTPLNGIFVIFRRLPPGLYFLQAAGSWFVNMLGHRKAQAVFIDSLYDWNFDYK